MDRKIAERLAELINTEQMDLITFEAIAGDPDQDGKRPTLQAIQKRRQAWQNEAIKHLKTELAQDDPDPSQPILHPSLTELTQVSLTSCQSQLTENMQIDATVNSETAHQDLAPSCGIGQPVVLSDDPHTDTRSPTPGRTTPTAATAITMPRPIGDPGQKTTADTSPYSSESSHLFEVPGEGPAPDASSMVINSSRSIGEFDIGYSAQTPSVHNGQGQQPPSTVIPQASQITRPHLSTPSTPTQTSFNVSFPPAPIQSVMNPKRLWQNIKWAYLTHTSADIDLQSKGIWLFDKPPTCTKEKSNNNISSLQLHPVCSVVISSDLDDRSEPSLEYNETAMTLYTHLPPWADDHRSVEHFTGIVPDFHSEVPLAEYQTLEALGSHVWRHDRDLLPCRGPDCKRILSDIATTTIICLGCGPKSIVRFCSVQCHLASLSQHAVECGSYQLLINKLIDETTAPPRFSHFAPAIRDRQGYCTYQNYRQRVAAQYAGGRYTMFNPATEEATILIWDQRLTRHRGSEVPYPGYSTGMESRIERCLNIALFDHANTAVIEHLYRLVQLCLRVKNAWNPALAAILTRQFLLEFNYDANTSLRIRANEPFCECEWAGDAMQLHQATCQWRYRAQGELIRGQRSIKEVVEVMENKHWILRAWRQQHPTQATWTHRVRGAGFPGVVMEEGWMPKLGKGWVGFNGDEDDVAL
ncbi:MAG: hypothetical protein Q9178_007019 [Gyalolechia marmorata]